MKIPPRLIHTWGALALLLSSGCQQPPPPAPPSEAPAAAEQAPPADPDQPLSMDQQVRALGEGLRFLNGPVPEGAQTPEAGAEHVYARTFSANSRVSPVGIEIWVFDREGEPLQVQHEGYLRGLYDSLYGWDPQSWKEQLQGQDEAADILRSKSDLFWESLAQQLAERVFAESLTPALYRFGPRCLDGGAEGCEDPGLQDAEQVVVRTTLDARRDPMNPVTRSITYLARRGQVSDPELFFELQVPNGLRVAGPHQELLDFRPRIGGRQDAVGDIRIWAHLPPGRRARTKSADYPDYNLIFVPLRHLIFQGQVEDPKQPSTGMDFEDRESLLRQIEVLVSLLRSPEGGQRIAEQLRPFLSADYYYMFEAGGQGIQSYRDYILGESAGIARGLRPDFGRVELLLDGELAATLEE